MLRLDRKGSFVMHEKVREYLEKERQGQSAADRREREETLLRLGLWEKEYAPEKADDLSLYKETDDSGKLWRKVPIPVTDEEWAQIQHYAGKKRVNKWSTALWIFGGLFYFVAVYAFFMDAGLLSMLVWAAGGTLFSAVGKLIDTLDRH